MPRIAGPDLTLEVDTPQAALLDRGGSPDGHSRHTAAIGDRCSVRLWASVTSAIGREPASLKGRCPANYRRLGEQGNRPNSGRGEGRLGFNFIFIFTSSLAADPLNGMDSLLSGRCQPD